jgi:hypothetical protein
VLHLDVSKVNRVLHLPRCFSVASPRCLLQLRASAGHPPPLLLFPMLVTFGAAWETYAGSGWGGRRRSPRGARAESGGARVRSGMGLGCLDREARSGARAPTCVRTRVNGASGIDVRTQTSVRPGASKAHYFVHRSFLFFLSFGVAGTEVM